QELDIREARAYSRFSHLVDAEDVFVLDLSEGIAVIRIQLRFEQVSNEVPKPLTLSGRERVAVCHFIASKHQGHQHRNDRLADEVRLEEHRGTTRLKNRRAVTQGDFVVEEMVQNRSTHHEI